jgi:Putative peptidoglycan binding domain
MFNLTVEHLSKLWDVNHFPVPKDRWVFFGLRGCLPVDDAASAFVASHPVRVESVDYVHPRCTLGQWHPDGRFALFPGSTVPHRTHVAGSLPAGGAGTNQLMTGCYPDYRKGRHKAGTPTGHEAFRQDNKLPVHRSSDDLDFDSDDRVEFDQPFDNLHAAWSHGVDHDSYASAGCQVVVGFPQCDRRDNRPDTGPWGIFKANAYVIPQDSFFYVLLTGHEAERMAQGASAAVHRLRYGSKGPLVTRVQEALKAKGFYEGRIDDDFGIRTLRAVLRFQTTEFGSGGDDGIIGAQTASALGIEWPAQPAPLIAVGAVPPAPAPAAAEAMPTLAASMGGVRFDGDNALGPDGARFAKRFKKGVFTIGKTSIRDYVSGHLSAFPGVPVSLLNVIQAVSENEGKLEAINTWDDSFMTFGVFQWTAGQGNTRGELAALLHRLKSEHGGVFNELFGRHGLDVQNVVPARSGVTPVGSFSLNGVPLTTPAQKERLRTLDWAHRFWLAGHDDTVRTIQVKQAMDRLAIFYRSPKHLVLDRMVAAYVSSEAGVALLLDQHVNRPSHVPKPLTQAVAQLAAADISVDPSGWSDEEERELLKAYIDLRSDTSMTDSDKRAQVVIEAVAERRLSDQRGSFVEGR